ncbi:UvrD-helicase domain-containing protein [Escherichia coli]
MKKSVKRWQNKIRYLLVDEYQDTNTSQYELVKLMVGERRVLPWWATMTSRSTLARCTSTEPVPPNEASPALKVIKVEQNYRS